MSNKKAKKIWLNNAELCLKIFFQKKKTLYKVRKWSTN